MNEYTFDQLTFSTRLANTIVDRQLTLRQVGDQIGIAASTISRVIAKNAVPDLETFARLCSFLETSPGEFFDRIDLSVETCPRCFGDMHQYLDVYERRNRSVYVCEPCSSYPDDQIVAFAPVEGGLEPTAISTGLAADIFLDTTIEGDALAAEIEAGRDGAAWDAREPGQRGAPRDHQSPSSLPEIPWLEATEDVPEPPFPMVEHSQGKESIDPGAWPPPGRRDMPAVDHTQQDDWDDAQEAIAEREEFFEAGEEGYG